MKKIFLTGMVIGCLALGACAGLRRPVSSGSMEMRAMAPADVAKIRAVSEDAQEAAAELWARMAGRKSSP